MSITLIAGLGNPGREYRGTRHNLGFVVVDALAAAESLTWKKEPRFEAETARWTARRSGTTRLLVKPQTFMNGSGRSLRQLLDFHRVPVESLIVIHDDLTLEVGRVKVTVRGSAGGHNGIESLLEHVGSGFIRFRLGIGAPRPAGMDIKDFVLGKFSTDEQTIIDQQLKHFVTGLRLLIDSGYARAMNTLNRRDQHEQS
ncbi:MAG: aminoacyl-tRNA hydrolase [Opitutaceae bacterium]|nr:aminoacyl-tRNA hydrolase [Opitutaceae bacterium]